MKCYKCNKKEGKHNIPSLQKLACNQCYTEIIEKRFRKNCRVMNITKATVTIKQPSDEVLKHLLNKKGTPEGKKIKQYTLDDYCISILKSFKKGKNHELKGNSPLSNISEQELKTYAIINKLKFRKNPRTGLNKELQETLKKLDHKRPGVMTSIKKFMKQLT